jgi:hypothetical protein
MKQHFLMVYNRREGRIVRKLAYRDASEAIQARFAVEQEFDGQADIEIVVLGGQSWQAVRRTHSRYFSHVQDLAKTGLERLATATS